MAAVDLTTTLSNNITSYDVSFKKKSVAIIFNHEKFDIKYPRILLPRTGTKVDSKNLKIQLKNLGYKVERYNNPSWKKIREVTERAAKYDHSERSNIVIVILTHGNLGILYARDTMYSFESLWMKFTANNCPTLAGKPKLFFVQACQGIQVDNGIMLHPIIETDSVTQSFKPPTEPDFLIAYSTVPGYYSWRNPTYGSWFIQALCSQLELHASSMDLLALLTIVCRRVAIDFESVVLENKDMHEKKQMPCIIYTLTKQFYFKHTTK